MPELTCILAAPTEKMAPDMSKTRGPICVAATLSDGPRQSQGQVKDVQQSKLLVQSVVAGGACLK